MITTQKEKIIKYIEQYGSITPFEAFASLHITKLATRISELVRDGYKFDKKMLVGINCDGKRDTYMRYKLVGYPANKEGENK